MSGCGATGRLSLVLETLKKQIGNRGDQVIGFMAGGDYALIKSVESFEDRTDYGERQLLELGFKDQDLLIAITEGGETPFVIGSCQTAKQKSKIAPYFVYCYPDDLLQSIARSQEVLADPQIKKLNLTVGPMALTGSTRLQAASVQLLGVGLALLYEWPDANALKLYIEDWQNFHKSFDYGVMGPMVLAEAEAYQKEHLVNYITESNLAISVLSDTTERSPTFSQRAFENLFDDPILPSKSFVSLPDTDNSSEAWDALLSRPPRCLNWENLPRDIGQKALLGFDISSHATHRREKFAHCLSIHVTEEDDSLSFDFCGEEISVTLFDKHPLTKHLVLKMLLNAHSTVVMGRLGFYENNIMTWVRPSNNKLIDRATRYLQFLCEQRNKTLDYAEGVALILQVMNEREGEERPVVIEALEKLK